MKKTFFIVFLLVFVLPFGRLWAGAVTLVTYYPAPTLSANKLQMQESGGNCGTPGSPLNQGMLFLETDGTLKLCNSGVATSYPQQCYNSFCAYTSPGTCTPVCNAAAGYTAVAGVSDTIQTDATHFTVSVACCGGG